MDEDGDDNPHAASGAYTSFVQVVCRWGPCAIFGWNFPCCACLLFLSSLGCIAAPKPVPTPKAAAAPVWTQSPAPAAAAAAAPPPQVTAAPHAPAAAAANNTVAPGAVKALGASPAGAQAVSPGATALAARTPAAPAAAAARASPTADQIRSGQPSATNGIEFKFSSSAKPARQHSSLGSSNNRLGTTALQGGSPATPAAVAEGDFNALTAWNMQELITKPRAHVMRAAVFRECFHSEGRSVSG
jgi:pyruvate/2-oxoglutarate dehydrogenase complex dihydrolipoamide acyltransferase (E2) component